MKLIASIALATVLTGCATHNLRHWSGAIVPVEDGTYIAQMIADNLYPDDSARAEQQRLRVLDDWMEDDGYCPKGYAITKREAVITSKNFLGESKDINYTLVCNG